MAKHEYRTDTLEVRQGASLISHLETMEDAGWDFVALIPPTDASRLVVLMRRATRRELRAT